MAEFSEAYSCFKSFADAMDPNMELLSNLPELSCSAMDYFGDVNPSYLSEFSLSFHDVLLGLLHSESSTPMAVAEQKPVSSAEEQVEGDKKRKAAEAPPDSGSQNCSEVFSGTGLPEAKARKKNSSPVSKKRRSNSKENGNPKDVVHVRARRGQATDSHSLAERVRREKINARMRCLQDLVPGCYKTMGMAGMLDEIINYVQSLQNQVEFLSMKLSAASSFYDYNLDMKTVAAAAEAPPHQVGSGAYYIDEAPQRNRARDMVEEEMAAAAAAAAHPQEQVRASSALPCPFDPTFGPWLHPCL